MFCTYLQLHSRYYIYVIFILLNLTAHVNKFICLHVSAHVNKIYVFAHRHTCIQINYIQVNLNTSVPMCKHINFIHMCTYKQAYKFYSYVLSNLII